jgi:hypothetical protein
MPTETYTDKDVDKPQQQKGQFTDADLDTTGSTAGGDITNPDAMFAKAQGQAHQHATDAANEMHGPGAFDEKSSNEDAAAAQRKASGNTFQPSEFSPEGAMTGAGGMATLGLMGQAVTNPLAAARGLTGAYIGGRTGGAVAKKAAGFFGADPETEANVERVGNVGGGLLGGGLMASELGRTAANEGLSKVSPTLANKLFPPPEEPYTPQGTGPTPLLGEARAAAEQQQIGAHMARGYRNMGPSLMDQEPGQVDMADEEGYGSGRRPAPLEREGTRLNRKLIVTEPEYNREQQLFGDRAKIDPKKGIFGSQASKQGTIYARRAGRGMKEPRP